MARSLVIDDETQLLESIAALLEANGLSADLASAWDEGLELFEILQHDLVIADYNMPGSRNGLRLLVEVKRQRPSVRVVLISAYLDEGDFDEVLKLGLIDRALSKGSSEASSDAIVEEIRAAEESSNEPTDWVKHSQAALDVDQVLDHDLNKLDALLRGSAKGRGAP